MDKKVFIQKAALMQPTYTSSLEVKQYLSQVDLIAAVGPTGAGKTSIMEHSGIPLVTSYTSRPPRKGEDNGIDFIFRNDYEQLMKELINGEFVQFVINSNDEFYGTKIGSYPASGPCTMTILASAIEHFFTMGFRKVQPVYIIPPSYDEWMKRVKAHHDKDLPARLIEAKVSLVTALSDSRYHFLINGDLLRSSEVFNAVAHGQLDTSGQEQGRELALQLLTGIQTIDPENPSDLL